MKDHRDTQVLDGVEQLFVFRVGGVESLCNLLELEPREVQVLDTADGLLDTIVFQRIDRPEADEKVVVLVANLRDVVVGNRRVPGVGFGVPAEQHRAADADIAARNPDLQILIAHPAFPWEREQLAICQQKGNVYMDLSGWMPRYIDDQVLHYAETLLKDKVMFGTDYPMIDPGPWLEQFAELDYAEEIQRKILWKNAESFLGL